MRDEIIHVSFSLFFLLFCRSKLLQNQWIELRKTLNTSRPRHLLKNEELGFINWNILEPPLRISSWNEEHVLHRIARRTTYVGFGWAIFVLGICWMCVHLCWDNKKKLTKFDENLQNHSLVISFSPSFFFFLFFVCCWIGYNSSILHKVLIMCTRKRFKSFTLSIIAWMIQWIFYWIYFYLLYGFSFVCARVGDVWFLGKSWKLFYEKNVFQVKTLFSSILSSG